MSFINNMPELLNSHCLAVLRSGEIRILAKVGNSGTKILVNPATGAWNYLSHWDVSGRVRHTINAAVGETALGKNNDIIEVWGRVTGTANYGTALWPSTEGRKLLYRRTPPVKLTYAQLCEKLGYEVEIIDLEGTPDE